MYNQYIPDTEYFGRVEAEAPPPEEPAQGPDTGERERKTSTSPGPAGEASKVLDGLLKVLKLEDLDRGDLLLLLIILLLLSEGDNLDMVITLGLMLVMGQGGH